MDANKLAELQRVGYVVHRSCGLCVHGRFGASDWGTCAAVTYEHRKHTGPPRQLSIYRGGSCRDSFEPDQSAVAKLGAFASLMDA